MSKYEHVIKTKVKCHFCEKESGEIEIEDQGPFGNTSIRDQDMNGEFFNFGIPTSETIGPDKTRVCHIVVCCADCRRILCQEPTHEKVETNVRRLGDLRLRTKKEAELCIGFVVYEPEKGWDSEAGFPKIVEILFYKDGSHEFSGMSDSEMLEYLPIKIKGYKESIERSKKELSKQTKILDHYELLLYKLEGN